MTDLGCTSVIKWDLYQFIIQRYCIMGPVVKSVVQISKHQLSRFQSKNRKCLGGFIPTCKQPAIHVFWIHVCLFFAKTAQNM